MDLLEKYLVRLKPKPSTYSLYKVVLEAFFKTVNLTAEEFLELAKQNKEDARYVVEGYLADLLRQGRSPKYVRLVKTIILNFLRYFDVNLKVMNHIADVAKYPDYIPTKEEVIYLLDKARGDLRAVIALMAFAGMRPIDVINLRFLNVSEEVEYDGSVYKPKKIPMKIVVQQSKTMQWYVTFLGPRGAEILCNYLTELSRKLGRPLKPNDKLFDYKAKWTLENKFEWFISKYFQRNFGHRRFRPYSLRKYFRRATMKLGENIAEYLLGHVNGINSLSATYSGLRDLDPVAIEELRREYAKIIPELEGSNVISVVDEKMKEELEYLRKRVKALEKALEFLVKGLGLDDFMDVIRIAVMIKDLKQYKEIMMSDQEHLKNLSAIIYRKLESEKKKQVELNI